jgi:hypothetical protein
VQHVYIYYRIDPAQLVTAARAVDSLLAALAPYCKSMPRRLARCDEPALWMEIYEGITDIAAFTQHLDTTLRLLHPHQFIVGERHLERFCQPHAQA